MRVKFADTLKIINGKNQQKVEDPQGKYPIYGSGGIMGYANDYICPAETVIIGRKGSINKPIFADTPFWNVDTAFGLCTDKAKLFPKYLYYFCVNFDFECLNTTVTIPSLTKSNLLNIEIPPPPLDEQRRIAAVLDKVSNLITKRREQLDKLDELVKARFVEMFGTSTKQVPLTDYVWFQEGPGVRSVDFTDSGTILLTGSNINDNVISFGHKSDRYVSNELAAGKYAHFMCDQDDILVVSSAIDPDRFDKKVVVVEVGNKYCLNTGIIRFKPNKHFLTIGYFREFLKTDFFKRQVSSEMRGIAQMHFGPSHLKQMTIMLPESMEQQIEFEAFVSLTDKSKLTIQRSLDKMETLKKALMQEYFG